MGILYVQVLCQEREHILHVGYTLDHTFAATASLFIRALLTSTLQKYSPTSTLSSTCTWKTERPVYNYETCSDTGFSCYCSHDSQLFTHSSGTGKLEDDKKFDIPFYNTLDSKVNSFCLTYL